MINDLKKDNIEITINTDNTIVLHYFFPNSFDKRRHEIKENI